MTMLNSSVARTDGLVPTNSPTSKVEKLDIPVQQQVELALDTWVLKPGSVEYIRVLINGWDTTHMRHYMREVLDKDRLLSEVFEVTSVGLMVKSEARILEAHFGDYISSVGKRMNMRVVPGVILKRLISSLFSIELYSHTELPPIAVGFNSGVVPGAIISFDLLEDEGGLERKTPDLAMFTGKGPQKKIALAITDGESLSPSDIEELQAASLKPRTRGINFSPTEPLDYLAQWGDFRFALNTAIIDAEQKIYQTLFGYPRQIDTQAKLEHRKPSMVFERNNNTDLVTPWEILEEAVCQAVTLAVQKYIFESPDSPKKKTPSKDSLIVLSESTSQVHRSSLVSERELLNITFKVAMNAIGEIDFVNYIVTPKISQGVNPIMSGTIHGTRIPKIVFARTLRA
jgi:hypothetical protein